MLPISVCTSFFFLSENKFFAVSFVCVYILRMVTNVCSNWSNAALPVSINVETKQIDLIEVEAIVIASRGCKVGRGAQRIEEAHRMSILYRNLLYKL